MSRTAINVTVPEKKKRIKVHLSDMVAFYLMIKVTRFYLITVLDFKMPFSLDNFENNVEPSKMRGP